MIDPNEFVVSEKNGCLSLDKYTGTKENVEIPDGINVIGRDAFRGCESVRSVIFPKSVKTISREAFRDLTNLESVVFSEGLEKIENEAFRGCKNLKEAILPDSLKVMEFAAFDECENLENIRFGKKLKSLEATLLSGNKGIQRLVIPATIQKIQDYSIDGIKGIKSLCFEGKLKNKKIYVISCQNLSEITFAEEVENIKGVSIVACPLVKEVTIANKVYKVIEKSRPGVGSLADPDQEEKPATVVDMSTPVEFSFNEEMDMFVCEYKGLMFSIDHEPDEKACNKVRILAENYISHLNEIVKFMLPDLKEIFGNVTAKTAAGKLGKPVIEFMNGRVVYLEQTFDGDHIFEFEFMGDDFEDLENFSIDG